MAYTASTASIHIRIPTKTLKSIDHFMGKRRRNAFIRASTDKELKKLCLLNSLDKAYGAWIKEDHPELRFGSVAYQRKLRRESDRGLRNTFKR